MQHGVGKAGAGQRDGLEAFEAMRDKLEPRVLAGDIEARPLTKRGEGMGDRTELDGFRARPDDERDT